MSDEPPHLRIVSRTDDPELDMRGLRMWAIETAAMVVTPGPRWHEKVLAAAERFVGYVLEGARNDG